MSEAVTQSTNGKQGALPTQQRSLVRKLAEVMALVKRVPKNGRNEFHKYDYATEADILDAVRDAMAERRLVLVPSALEAKSEPRGDKGEHLFTLRSRFTIHDGDSGEELAFDMYGQGSDKLDKACYKAATGAEKYAVLKLFMISTGDDPENEEPRREIPPPAGMEALRKHVGSNAARPPPSPPKARVPTEPPQGYDRTTSFSFGKDKGVSVADLSESSLKWYSMCFQRDLTDESKAQYHAKTRAQLAVVEAELRHRGL